MIVDSDEPGEPAWPTAEAWSEALEDSRAVASPTDYAVEPFRPLVFDGRRIYLQRYWEYELSVARDLRERAVAMPAARGVPGPFDLEQVLDSLFGMPSVEGPDLQRQ